MDGWQVMHWIYAVGSIVNVVAFAYLLLLTRRTAVLRFLLQKLVVDAFLNRHLPVWVPWADAFGRQLTLSAGERE